MQLRDEINAAVEAVDRKRLDLVAMVAEARLKLAKSTALFVENEHEAERRRPRAGLLAAFEDRVKPDTSDLRRFGEMLERALELDDAASIALLCTAIKARHDAEKARRQELKNSLVARPTPMAQLKKTPGAR